MAKKTNPDLFMNYLYRAIIFTLCLSFLLVLSNSAIANDKSVFNIDMYFGWGGYFRPMEWTPVEITINNSLEQHFGGELTLSSQQDGLNTLNIMVQDLALTAELTEYIPLVTKIAYTNQICSLKLDRTTGRRKTVWSHNYNIMMNPGKIPALNEFDMLIGVIGAGKFGLLGLEKQSTSYYKGVPGNVYVGNKQAAMVPWDWTGFVSLDLLILYDPDWNQLKEQQLKAISEWITNGGKMLLVLGSKPPMGENPLTKIIPFDYTDTKQVNISQQQLYEWKLSENSSETVTLRPLVPKPNVKLYEGDLYQGNQYLFGIGNAGFGTIGVLGFDPEDFSYSQDTNKSRFWVNLIKTIIKSEGSVENTILAQRRIDNVPDSGTNVNQFGQPILQNQQRNRNYYQIGSAYSLNNKVMEFLYQEIKPLSVWFVILLLGALAILLGPVDYKFLKHIDRLPLTWLTCTFWIIAFTIGAYYGVQYLRGGKTQLRVVSVIDGIKDEKTVWATQYSGLFASRSDSYELENLQPNQWWSGIAPTQDQLYSYSNEIGSRRIYCTQEDGGNLPETLPVNIWDIQCMLTESSIEKMPFSADVLIEGNEIIVTIKNESDAAIIGGYVMVDNRNGINFSGVPANSIQEFRRNVQPIRLWENDINTFTHVSQYSGQSTGKFKNEAAFFAQGSLQRTQAMNNYLNNGAAIVCVTYDNAPVSFKIKKHSVSEEHIQMARLVVFPN
ncbi:MAG: hypothetical protein JXA96_01565 [Sedimentisphaerales bacterium]|nr:hypothetical protein [Sedimentisphaerales bacterium]